MAVKPVKTGKNKPNGGGGKSSAVVDPRKNPPQEDNFFGKATGETKEEPDPSSEDPKAGGSDAGDRKPPPATLTKKTTEAKFKRQPRRSTPATPSPIRLGGSGRVAMKVDYGALLSVGILYAILRDPSSPKTAVYAGNYMSDLLNNTDDMAELTNTTAVMHIVDPKMPTQYKQVLVRKGNRYVQEIILLHVSPSPDSLKNPDKRLVFARNHAKVLTAYGKSTFAYPTVFEAGDDLTHKDVSASSVLADFLTWSDTMEIMKENIFVDQTTETLANCTDIMKEYFGAKHEKAKQYFTASTQPVSDLGLESFD